MEMSIDYIGHAMKLITKIRPQRRKTGLTQADLAAEVGVSRQTIISIEKGSCVPSTFLALKLARALQRPVEELFTIEE
jgi:putative transcriptional regulator